MRPCDDHIKETLELVEKMIDLSVKGLAEREDDECAIMYGVLLDSAYKISQVAEAEKEKHIKKGWWK